MSTDRHIISNPHACEPAQDCPVRSGDKCAKCVKAKCAHAMCGGSRG